MKNINPFFILIMNLSCVFMAMYGFCKNADCVSLILMILNLSYSVYWIKLLINRVNIILDSENNEQESNPESQSN